MAAGRLDRELRIFDQTLIPKEAGEDTQAIARLLGLGAIRVEDAQAELALLGGEGTPEDAIGAHAKIAVADHARLVLGRDRPAGKIRGVQDEVVIAEGVVLVEAHGNRQQSGLRIEGHDKLPGLLQIRPRTELSTRERDRNQPP